jgi:DNA-directed RNA polymerase specialized sigma24 family protein/ribosome-associated translation inhibitor RaiA
MIQRVFFQDVKPEIKERIQEEWAPKAARIERLLPRAAGEELLRLNVRHVGDHFEIHAILNLKRSTLVAQYEASAYHEALERVADRLIADVRRHKEVIREDYLQRRKRRPQQDELAAVIPRLDEHVSRDERDLFFDLVRPYAVRVLRDHAHRELVIAQLEGRVERGSVAVSDLVDETLTRTWDRWDERPRAISLDHWLVSLLHEDLDARTEPGDAAGHVEDTLPPDDPRYEADNGWVIESSPYWGALEPLRFEDVIAGPESVEPWEAVAAEEQRRWILGQLSTFPRERRRAFTLSGLEGWGDEEIARLQGRTDGEVRGDIEAVRAALRDRHQRLQTAELKRRSA